jgi:dephospho-CoA kinase
MRYVNIADNIIKHHLQNVYVITGHACGGKTTTSRYLADKYDMILLDWDEQFATYQALVDPRYQPAIRTSYTV